MLKIHLNILQQLAEFVCNSSTSLEKIIEVIGDSTSVNKVDVGKFIFNYVKGDYTSRLGIFIL